MLAKTDPDGDEVTDQPTTTQTDNQSPAIQAILYVERGAPSWISDGGLEDVQHGIAVWFSRERFIAIRVDGFLADAIQTWLDKSPRPPFRRIGPKVLQGEFFQGEVKNLWLKGVHPRRNTMADTKYLSGPRLQDALSPLTDASFAPSAGKSELALDPTQPGLRMRIGCAPAKSTVWVKRAIDFDELRTLALAILEIVARAVASGSSTPGLPWLATRQDGLQGVCGAYELVASIAEEVGNTGSSQDVYDAAVVLEGAELHVRGDPSSANFEVDVGLDGRTGGTVGCTVVADEGRIRLSLGVRGTPTDEKQVTQVLSALRHTELLTVHYESGHAVTEGAAWTSTLGSSAFPRWVWQDFSGWNIIAEKPSAEPATIHSLTGDGKDKSLFSWVACHFDSGYLTCDDGSGEVADFVHIGNDDTLSLIHVKAASSRHPKRKLAVQRYEAVVSQALKNVAYLDTDRLADALTVKRSYPTAAWLDGSRLPNRTDMIEYLAVRPRSAPTRVIVVQPHVVEEEHSRSWTNKSMKVRLLDTLLNSARGAVTGMGAELEVWGSASSE